MSKPIVRYRNVKPPLPHTKGINETMAELAELEERFEEASKLYHLAMKEAETLSEMERLRRKSLFAYERYLLVTDI